MRLPRLRNLKKYPRPGTLRVGGFCKPQVRIFWLVYYNGHNALFLNRLVNRTVLLQLQGLGGLVAYLGGTKVLDRTGIYVAGVHSPLVAMCGKVFEGGTVEVNEGFLDHGFHLAVTTLHVHHHGHGHTAGNPFAGRFGGVAYRRHVTGAAFAYEQRCGVTQRVAVVGIELRLSSRPGDVLPFRPAVSRSR